MIVELVLSPQAGDPANLVQSTRDQAVEYFLARGYIIELFPEVRDWEKLYAFYNQSEPIFKEPTK